MRSLLLIALAPFLLFCSAPAAEDSDLEESYGEIQGVAPLHGSATKYPIVLTHGFNGSTTNKWSFYKVADALRADGHVVYEAEVEPYNTPEVRALSLRKTVDLALKSATKVNIIAHSMGGLDSRELISSLGYGDRVASLTTISTPHHGTYVGDVAGHLVPGGPIGDAVDALASAWGHRFTTDELADNTDLHAALVSISEKGSVEFNETHPNDSRVYYQSWAGVSARIGIGDSSDKDACDGMLDGSPDVMDSSLRAGSVLVSHGFGWQSGFQPSDGMVTVKSAKFGNFRGCIRADHLDEIGQPKHDHANLRTKFDHLRFLRGIAFELAEKKY